MNYEPKSNVQKTVSIGVMAAILAVLSQISVPLPSGVPVTLQTFAVALCGYFLGPALGTAAVGVYLVLGAVGVPILAGFAGGLGSFIGVTGGFLWGFLPMAFLCGLGVKIRNKLLTLALGLAGLAACHLCGGIQFSLVMNTPFLQAFLIATLPYLAKDIVSVILAYLGATALKASLKKAGLGDIT